MDKYVHKVLSADHHRNGVCGAPFQAVVFDGGPDGHGGRRRMFAVLFDGPGTVAVFDLDKLAEGNVAFGDNSWRGDAFEPELRALFPDDEEES